MGLLRLFGNGEQELVLSGPDTVSAKGVVVRVVGCRCCNAQGKEIRMGKASKGFAMKKKKVIRKRKSSAMYRREQKDRQRRTEVRTHNFKLPGHAIVRA